MLHRKYFMKTFLVLALFSICYTITSLYVLYSRNSSALHGVFHQKEPLPDYFSCLEERQSKHLKMIDADSVAENSIFFLETSCKWYLRNREACSVESAARAHPHKKIYVIFTRALSKADCKTGILAELDMISNVYFYRRDINYYTFGTPLKNISILRLVTLGKWDYKKTGELLKILTLSKFTGMVIDLDMMVVGSLDKLGHDWASSDGESFESGIISVGRGLSGVYYADQFYKTLKQQIAYDLGQSMESALRTTLQSICNTTNITMMTRESCREFQVYTSQFFSAGNRSWSDLKPTSNTEAFSGYYLWSEARGNHTSTMPKNSLYASLAKKHCPMVYSKFMANNDNESVIHL